MVPDREGGFRGDIGLEELGAPPPVVGLNQRLHDVVKQAGQDDFFCHASFHSASGALKNVISGSKTVLEEIEQRRIGRQGLGLLDVSASVIEKITDASAVAARVNLGVQFGYGWKLLVGAGGAGCSVVQLLGHVFFQCVGFRLRVHGTDGGRAAETGKKRASVDLHRSPFARISSWFRVSSQYT